ncbi:MAG: hypothetical protein ACP5D9_10460, partial [Mariniphaga sp.]
CTLLIIKPKMFESLISELLTRIHIKEAIVLIVFVPGSFDKAHELSGHSKPGRSSKIFFRFPVFFCNPTLYLLVTH